VRGESVKNIPFGVWPSEENFCPQKIHWLEHSFLGNKAWQVYIIFSITLLPWQLQ
jgi:hypothetical protein